MKASVGIVFLVVIGAIGAWAYLASVGALSPEPVVEILPKGGTNGTLKVVTDADYWPYSFIDRDGKLSGREIEIANAVANELGMNIEISPLPWEGCVDAAVEHKVDLVMTCADISIGREMDALSMSTPFESDNFVVYGRKKISSLDDLRGQRIGLMLDGNVNSVMFAAGLKPFVRQYPTYRDVLEAIRNGEADFTVARHNSVVGWLKETPVPGLKPQLELGPSLCCIGVDNEQPELLKQVDTAIALLRLKGVVAALNEKWLTTYVEPIGVWKVVAGNRFVFLSLAVLIVGFSLLLLESVYRRHRARIVRLRLKNERMLKRLADATKKAAEDTFDVRTSFEGVRSPLQAYADGKGVAISFEYGAVTERCVLTDVDKCAAVLLNVGLGAIWRTAMGGRVVLRCEQVEKPKKVRIRGEETDVAIYRYTIRDNGAGEDTWKGMSIAVWEELVKSMGGTVECRVKPSVGSTVIITLPLKLEN